MRTTSHLRCDITLQKAMTHSTFYSSLVCVFFFLDYFIV